MSDAIHAGAAALQDLIRRIKQQGDADLEAAYQATGSDKGDARNYRALIAMVAQDLENNLHHQSPSHREGYLRGLTDLFSQIADGGDAGEGWDPIRITSAAFQRTQLACTWLIPPPPPISWPALPGPAPF